jgi:hypothetical protein
MGGKKTNMLAGGAVIMHQQKMQEMKKQTEELQKQTEVMEDQSPEIDDSGDDFDFDF